MKSAIGISLAVLLFTATSLAFELTCSYRSKTDWSAIDNLYYCELNHDIESSKLKNDVITSVTGCHLHSHYNSDVMGFRSENKSLEYFPRGMEKYFNTSQFQFIAVWIGGLKEINQDDLSPFTSLRVLSLWTNEIEVIKRDLFKFNPMIEYLTLGSNKIKMIDGNAFDNLNRLTTFYMRDNVCISNSATRDRKTVLKIIDQIKEKCKG